MLRTASHWVFYGNIFIALCAVCMTLETYLILDLPVTYKSTFPLLLIVFCSTFFIYNIDLFAHRNNSIENIVSGRLIWRIKYRAIIKTINIGMGLLILALSSFSTYKSFLFFVHLAVISLAYYFSFEIGSAKFTPLRKIPLLKAFVISYVWAGSSVLLPALRNSISIVSSEVLQIFIERYFFLFALAIMFDIRDLSADHKNIRTIPGLVGSFKTKVLSFLLLFVATILVLLDYKNPYLICAFVISFLVAAFFIYKAKTDSGEYYFLLLVDGSMILQFLLVLLSLNL
jgi:4-hydroxybenzoate polyprenyltransferase